MMMQGPDWVGRRGAACGLALSGLLVGCSSKPGILLEEADAQRFWPPPPDEPRIRYVGQIRSSEDLRAGKTGLESLGEAIFGKETKPGLLSPIAVCSDGADRVFIADSSAAVVHVFNLRTRRYERWSPGKGRMKEGGFSQPVAVAWDPIGRLLVADSVEGVIFVFDSGGTSLGTFGEGVVQRPCGIAVDADAGRLFVADVAAHQVVVLGRDGEATARFGARGSAPGQFNFPTNVALGPDGRVYVSDSLNFRVQVFGPDLAPITQVGRQGDMPGYFSQPKGVAVDGEGHLYVVDANFEAVQLFDANGSLLMAFGREGRGPGEFWLPAGIHIDSKGRIWVADGYNKRVQVFERVHAEALP